MFQILQIGLLCFTPQNLPIRVKEMSTWLGFSLKNARQINQMIPSGTEVAPVKILSNDICEPKLLFNIYESESTFFKGLRCEVVTVVRQRRDPSQLHFVVLECLSNTLHWDPLNGIQLPNSRFQFGYDKEKLNIDCRQNDSHLRLYARLGHARHITKRFAVDANLVCFFRNSFDSVKLSFDEEQIMKDVNLLSSVQLETNMWDDYRGKLTHCFVHTHHMDFTADVINFMDHMQTLNLHS